MFLFLKKYIFIEQIVRTVTLKKSHGKTSLQYAHVQSSTKCLTSGKFTLSTHHNTETEDILLIQGFQ